MTQEERRVFLIKYLLDENPQYAAYTVPKREEEQKMLLRSLMNVRAPSPISSEFLNIQDEYLQTRAREKGITQADDLSYKDGMTVWQGNITTLACGAIVNAANSAMLGCFHPCHKCIDNCIHTFAGVQLRLECAEIMRRQDASEKTGKAKITAAYNLPSKHVIHTVGPVINGSVSEEDRRLLASCYSSCLTAADSVGAGTVAFCCISTGEFHYPSGSAAQTAVKAVKDYKKKTGSKIKVIFDVFRETDKRLYNDLLG